MDETTPTYRKRLTPVWWLRNPRTVLYMLREVSSLFVLLYALVFLALVLTSPIPETYETVVGLVRSRPFVLFTLLTLGFALIHGVTWWSLTSRVMTIRLGSRVLPPWMVFGGALVAWAAVSGAVYFLIFRGGFLP